MVVFREVDELDSHPGGSALAAVLCSNHSTPGADDALRAGEGELKLDLLVGLEEEIRLQEHPARGEVDRIEGDLSHAPFLAQAKLGGDGAPGARSKVGVVGGVGGHVGRKYSGGAAPASTYERCGPRP